MTYYWEPVTHAGGEVELRIFDAKGSLLWEATFMQQSYPGWALLDADGNGTVELLAVPQEGPATPIRVLGPGGGAVKGAEGLLRHRPAVGPSAHWHGGAASWQWASSEPT